MADDRAAGRRQRPHRRRAAGAASATTCAAGAWRWRRSARTRPTRWTTPTSPAAVARLVARGEADARHRHRRRGARLGDRRQQGATACAPRCAPIGRWPATPASTTAPTCSRWARRSSRRRRHSAIVDTWLAHADDRTALHPPARRDPGAGAPSGERPVDGRHAVDLRRLVAIIAEELAAYRRRRPSRAARVTALQLDCCPHQVQGVLDAGAARLGLPRRRRRRRRASPGSSTTRCSSPMRPPPTSRRCAAKPPSTGSRPSA